MSTRVEVLVKGGVGQAPPRPDGIPKLTGDFAFASDAFVEGMLWGATLRSPHPRARIRRLETAPALALAGVHAVLTLDDVTGERHFGLEIADQPVLSDGEIRYWGEPIAIVAADDPYTAARAAAAIHCELEELEPVVDSEQAQRNGDIYRHLRIRHGDQSLRGEVVVEGQYQVGMQDQAPLGTEAGLAVPDSEGGVDLYAVSQWLHVDHRQIVASLGLAPEQVRCHPTGVGGAFGAREDVSLHIHLCMLALRTGRPVKMIYSRAESFSGHVHRHPARLWYRHEANRDGELIRVEAKLLLDGGAYASTTDAVTANAAYFSVGPYRCRTTAVDSFGVRTNNPPAGAMRGFGAVQACFGYESQMDRLASALGMDPLALRIRNALRPGDRLPTSGQLIEGSLPVTEVLSALGAMPLPDETPSDDPRLLPGGTGLTTQPKNLRRGVGYAASLKNLAFSEGFDDYAEARVVLTPAGAEVHTAAVEVGQNLVTVVGQIARSALGMERVAVLLQPTSAIGSAGSSSASRQTQMTGGAVLKAAQAVRAEALARADGDELTDEGVLRGGELVATLDQLCAEGPLTALVRFSHPPTTATDENGQGSPHADFAMAAHRAVVEVDLELGLVRIVRIDTAQDVGRVLNPQAVIGQIEGGIMQGVGLALMEEVVLEGGRIRNASFTDYLLPTILDAPDVEAVLIEEPSHWGPFGAKGVGEPPTISSTPAIAAAIRDATGAALTRVPVRPQDIVGV